ncbi:uncharacterized protein [Arachis hypogaea]|uniref:Uncharacterized protein n=1 Tax=Arachis hypogaea TaxID=3818 RepID=A0A444WVS1_ARAHY|nr:uncharacterized protein LOC112746838 [Arachis hypogaea]XP_025703289.1 uncharacterized protein LOC112804072 [Arachis hypogaea]QHO44447.1 uncharacterized protein DS421_5g171130 [Arachis hypogaea]RYQ81548.1 hypothetical protein Ahy_Scaffold1g107445 [Arachis hypogaea]
MEDTKTKLPSHESTIPLIARLDHLEFIMKYLERKQRSGNNNNNNSNVNLSAEKQYGELVAKKEAFFKGTLLDRVASLEHRLYQLCMEMDSSGSSYPLSINSTQDSGESSSSQESKGEICYSFPTFNNLPNHGHKAMLHNHTRTLLELQEQREGIKNPMKNSSKQQVVKNSKAKKKEKKGTVSVAKKRNPPISWPHLKLLGC